MIRIATIENYADLPSDLASTLQQAGYTAMPPSLGSNLDAWLEEHEADMLVLGLPGEDGRLVAAALSKSKSKTANGKTRWRINASQLELIAPAGDAIQLSHNECCILLAAAREEGHPVSRKTLIEALGENVMHYDERRLEALISRLRRKLVPHALNGFPVRAIKGHGYLFGVVLQVVEDGG